MAILNYTTSIDSEKTIAEIQKILVKAGAHKIVTDYQNQIPVSVTFALTIQGQLMGYALPARSAGVLKAMQKDRKIPNSKCTEEQAQRVAWRIVKDWVEAQVAIVQAQLAEVDEVFLPYAITQGGDTVYEKLKGNGMLMLQQ